MVALKYPLILKIGIPAVLLLMVFCFFLRKGRTYRGGRRVAGTEAVKKLSGYRKRLVWYRILSCIVTAGLVTGLISAMTLAARPQKTESTSQGVKKRDIFLCMDVSYSICDLNYELVTTLEKVVDGLNGDRFGISIFNTSTVLYVPMTDDYDFVKEKLEDLKDYFSLQKQYMEIYTRIYASYGFYTDPGDLTELQDLEEKLEVYDAGTLINNTTKGSSLIGEGLASCMYSFPRIEDQDRTRVVLLSTDNAEEHLKTPMLELNDAADLCRRKGIKVFGIFPDRSSFDSVQNTTDYDSDLASLKTAVELTRGRVYVHSSSNSTDDIIRSIREEEAKEVDEITLVKTVDQPEKPALVLLISVVVTFGAGLCLRAVR